MAWLYTTIGTQLTLQRGFDITKKQQRPGSVPVVSSGGIKSFHDTPIVSGPGVVMGRKGTLGKVFFIEKDFWPHDTTLWVKNFKRNNPRFVYYFFKNLDVTHLDVGSANPTLNRNHVHSINVQWPLGKAQDAIAAILGALDDKIELNRAMNRTLEEMAQAIFKSWFIDFDGHTDLVPSELGPIPRGWQISSISDICVLNRRRWTKQTAPEKIQYVSLGSVKNGTFMEIPTLSYDSAPSRAQRIISHGDTILGTVRPANRSYGLVLEPSTDLTGSTGFAVLSPQVVKDCYFLYLWVTRAEFIEFLASIAHGSAYPAVDPKVIVDASFVEPHIDLKNRFFSVVDPLFRRIHLNTQESRTLAELRDTLLPRLISGELRIPEAEKAVERVL